MDENRITYFAETDARNKKIKFGIKAKDRARHVYVIGKTGMGKSTLLENMAVQDIQSGKGVAIVDPHGDLAEELLEYIPEERKKDLIYLNPDDLDHPIGISNKINRQIGIRALTQPLLSLEYGCCKCSTIQGLWVETK
jgi:DNA helicase HerA-like ATPase